jgi:5'-3' exonuclease
MEGCEADDLVFAVASLYNSRGKSVLIYSGDNDLKQCVGFDHSTSAFTMQYQKQQKKVCLDKDTGFFLKKQGNTPLVNNIKSFINNSETKMLIVNPYEVVFDKVVMGDLGDNILPVASEIKLYKSGAKEGQEYESKVNAGTIKKIKEELNFLEYGVEDLFVDEFISKIASSVIRNFKADTKFKLDEVINNLKLNVSLVLLHKNTIPTSLYEGMIDWVETLHDSSKTTNTRKLCYQKDILQHISSYDKKETDNASSASIFKGLGL